MALRFDLDARRLALLDVLLREEALGSPASSRLPRRPEGTRPPLSSAQQRLWFLHRLDPVSPAYNLPVALELEGPLEVPALRAALDAVVARHEVLRTTFAEEAGTPYQVIHPMMPIPLPLVALGPRRDALEARLLEEVRRPFDLTAGPLLRALLLRVAPDSHVLLLNQHHAVSDGASIGLLLAELTAGYAEQCATGRIAPRPAPPVQYGDYAAWEQAQVRSGALSGQLAYWKERLRGAPEGLELPRDGTRPAAQDFRGARERRLLPGPLAAALRACCRAEGVTLFMALLALWNVLLHRLSGQADVVVGAPTTTRTRTELEGLIGFFVNTLVLRTDLSGTPTFRELLGQVRETVLEANAHRDVPFELLVDAVRPARALGTSPLFQVMFDVQQAPLPHHAAGVTFRFLKPPAGIAKFDLTLDVIERGEELELALEYATVLFAPETARRMLGRFETLLEGAVAHPEYSIAALPLLPLAERSLLLEGWNATAVDFGAGRRVHERFTDQATRQPEAIAVVGAGEPLSYGALEARSNRLACRLRALGLGPEERVGVCLERSPSLLVAVLGVLKAGGAYVPLDPDYPPERLAYMLADSGARVLLTESALLPRLPRTAARTLVLDTEEPGDPGAVAPPVAVAPEQLAYVIYTSGTTGRPKGTLVPHRALENAYCAWEAAYGLGELRAHLQLASFSFDVFTGDWVRALCSGAKLVLCPRELLLEPAQLYALMRQEAVDAAEFVPAVMRALVAHLEQSAQRLDFMKLLVVGSDSWHADEYTQFRRCCGPQTRLVNSYGVTEATIDSTYFEARVLPVEEPLPIGRPFANVRLYILDEQGQPAPVGVAGELFIGGAGVARGYHHRPALTASRFVPDPFGPPGGRLYRTGDRARYRRDGEVEFLGRTDHQIKLRGYRIEVGEVEAALARHPQVEGAVVVVQEREGRRQLVAYLVPASAPEAALLRRWLLERLPDYMVPTLFMALDAFPLTPNGKLDRAALPEVAPPPSEQGAAPRDGQEAALARVWAEVLGVEQVGIHDNFFELGGDSILSLQIIARAREAGLHFTPRQLFQHQTVAELAGVAGMAERVTAEQGPVTGEVPLTPIQRWFFAEEFVAPQHWNQAVLLEVREPLARTALERAVAAVVAHHDALRLRYERGTGGWRQFHAPPASDVSCEWVDLAACSETEWPPALEAHAAQVQAGLDLRHGPLWRVIYFDLGPGRSARLLLVAHHLVMDAVSLRILITDLQTAYYQTRAEARVALPPKTTSFKRWAERLVDYAREARELQAERDYWAAVVQQPFPPLPLDYAVSLDVNDEGRAAWLVRALDGVETHALLHEVPAAYNTQMGDVLLTALLLALAPWCGARCLLLDMEGHGREDLFSGVDLSRTVGWFTSVYPVWLDGRDVTGVGALLKRVKEQLRAIPRRGIGYGLLRYLAAEETLGPPGTPQLSFNYLGQFGGGQQGELFGEAAEAYGPLHSPRARRPYVLEIEAYISEGTLRVRWTYGQALHRRETIAELAEAYCTALREVIAHCVAPETGGYTPSDFPEAELSQADLDELMAEFQELI